MAFGRRRMVAPIVSKKHIIPQGVAAIAVNGISVIPIVTAVDAPTNADFDEVAVGSIVKAVYIEMWVRGDDETAPPANAFLAFEKLTGSSTNMIFADATSMNVYDNKSNVFYVTQGLVSAGTANSAIPFLRGWFKVPKGFQRMALGDRLVLDIVALNHDLEICGIFVYKEYQ